MRDLDDRTQKIETTPSHSGFGFVRRADESAGTNHMLIYIYTNCAFFPLMKW